MTDENRNALVFIAILLMIYFWIKIPSKVVQAQDETQTDPFLAPYYWPAAGYPADGFMNSGPAFSSTITVLAQNPLLGSLSQQYIPMFGFVGMTGA